MSLHFTHTLTGQRGVQNEKTNTRSSNSNEKSRKGKWRQFQPKSRNSRESYLGTADISMPSPSPFNQTQFQREEFEAFKEVRLFTGRGGEIMRVHQRGEEVVQIYFENIDSNIFKFFVKKFK